jgi:hypothetical protein
LRLFIFLGASPTAYFKEGTPDGKEEAVGAELLGSSSGSFREG